MEFWMNRMWITTIIYAVSVAIVILIVLYHERKEDKAEKERRKWKDFY